MVTGETLPEDEFEEMLNEFDTDGDGTITFDEFRAIMSTDH
jgi:Ca2+-binding EF-hand superfamily protein